MSDPAWSTPRQIGTSPSFAEIGDIALRLGSLFLQCGASTARVVKVMREVLSVLGLPRARVVVTPELMTVISGEDALPHPVMRVTPPISWNVHRLARLEQLATAFRTSYVDPLYLRHELEAIRTLPSPYSAWVRIVVAACTGALLTRLLKADWAGTAVAALACAAGQLVRHAIGDKMRLGATTLIVAFTASIVAGLGMRLHFSATPVATITGSVAILIPGLWLVTGGLDVMSGRHIRFGIMRLTVAFLLFSAIVIGIGFALVIGSLGSQ